MLTGVSDYSITLDSILMDCLNFDMDHCLGNLMFCGENTKVRHFLRSCYCMFSSSSDYKGSWNRDLVSSSGLLFNKPIRGSGCISVLSSLVRTEITLAQKGCTKGQVLQMCRYESDSPQPLKQAGG